MDPDFTALASRVAARAEVLGCIILSRDGLVLGAFPPHGEQDITPGLLRFAALGDPDRGFAEFPDELWAYVRGGSYAAFAVAEHGTRPGILLDYLEQALLVADEARQFGQAMTEPVHVDLSKTGARLGRQLRAATSDSESDFRAAVSAPTRESIGDGGQGDRGAQHVPVVPAVDDGALDEALAAAVAADGGPERAEPHDEMAEAPFAFAAPHPPEQRFEPTPEPFEPPQDQPFESPDDQHYAPPQEQHYESPLEAFAGVPHGGDEHGEADQAEEAQSTHAELPWDGPEAPPADPDEIDRVALAREFAQLLQEGPPVAD